MRIHELAAMSFGDFWNEYYWYSRGEAWVKWLQMQLISQRLQERGE